MCSHYTISNNVGSVKSVLCTPLRALEEERHFALAEKSANLFTKARLVICAGRTRSDPTISSITASTMITTSNSLRWKGADAQSLSPVI
jgi:hypothetical protein